jgi:hypothetical protein
MGLKAFLNDRYGPDAYDRYTSMLTSGKSDAQIAKDFSTEHRKLHYQTVGNWRRAYVEDKR